MAGKVKTIGSILVTIVGVAMLGYWTFFRYFTLAGGPWVAGHSCSSLLACHDGLCLEHERRPAGGELVKVAGYCSKRCKADGDCPADMRCESLPPGISNAAGDHLPVIKLPERLCVRGPRS